MSQSDEADFVGVTEIVERTGVSRQQVHTWVSREDFPAPVAHLAAGRFWEWGPVEQWIENRPRIGRPHRTEEA